MQGSPMESFAQKLSKGSCPVNVLQKKFEFCRSGSSNEQSLSSNCLQNVGDSLAALTVKDAKDVSRTISGCENSMQPPLDSDRNSNVSISIKPISSSMFIAQNQPGLKKKKKRDLLPLKLPPQDSRVSIIDSSLKKKWMESEHMEQPLLKQNLPPLNGKDFPDLTSALRTLSKCVIKKNCEVEEEGSSSFDVGDTPTIRKCRKKQPRKSDPISMNILDMIKKAPEEHIKSCQLSTKRKHYNEDRGKLAGNSLDSSNPIRKRGKHRETPQKKRLSKLKLVILNERCKKQDKQELLMRAMNVNVTYIKCERECEEDCVVEPVCEDLASLSISKACDTKQTGNGPCLDEQKKDKLHSCPSTVDGQDKSDVTLLCEETPFCSGTIASIMQISKNLDAENSVIHKKDNCGSDTNSTQQSKIKSALHSRKFREYCNNIRSQELDVAVTDLLKEIYRFQDRHFKKDPIRAHAKRRFVLGIREVKKFLMLKRLKAIIIAPDLESVESPGGLNEMVIQIREEGQAQHIPVVFAAGRRQLGFAVMKKVPISIIGIINPEGAEELYSHMLDEWHIASDKYNQKVAELLKSDVSSLSEVRKP